MLLLSPQFKSTTNQLITNLPANAQAVALAGGQLITNNKVTPLQLQAAASRYSCNLQERNPCSLHGLYYHLHLSAIGFFDCLLYRGKRKCSTGTGCSFR